MKSCVAIVSALAAMLHGSLTVRAAEAWLLDTTGLGDVGELYLAGTLQGIVNRDAPRLFHIKGTADAVYADYLAREI